MAPPYVFFFENNERVHDTHVFQDFSTENMKWLNIDQNLADFANFIQNVRVSARRLLPLIP
jgi:hypothetical protein